MKTLPLRSAGAVGIVLAVALALIPPPAGAEVGKAAPAPAFDEKKLAAIPERLREFVDKGHVSGAVTLVATREGVVHVGSVGKADIAADRPMREDTLFWIASMTKPVTATAVLMLQDEGKLSVEDLASKYVPELGQIKTAGGEPANLTLRHLLTHTSGMGEATREQEKSAKTLADLIPAYAKQPIKFTPGTRWQYSQSSINSAARVVEAVSGQSFPEFLEKRLFGPLAMKDTTFYPAAEQLARLAKSYQCKDGKPQEVQIMMLAGQDLASRDRAPLANGGLFSTAPDYARFCRMILNEGTLDGKRYLKPESVKLMTTLQTGDIATGFTPVNGWGLGWCVVRKPQGPSGALSPGSFGHGGAYGTQAWIDPQRGLAFILMVQRSDFPNADASDVRKTFQDAAVAALPTIDQHHE